MQLGSNFFNTLILFNFNAQSSQRHLKKIFSLYVLLLFSVSMLGGYTFILSLQQQNIRFKVNSIKDSLKTSTLVAFSDLSNDKDIEWIDDQEEFYYKGVRFDVVKKDLVNGVLVTWCYADDEETDIIAKIKATFCSIPDNKLPANTPLANVFKLLLQIFLPGEQISIWSCAYCQCAPDANACYYPAISSFMLEIPFPPPKSSIV